MENRSPNESKTTVNTATESIAQKIRKEMLGESITEEEYKQAMEQDTDATDEFEYIDDASQWPDGTPVHYYYKVPKLSEEDLKLIIADRTRKATEATATYVKILTYIVIALLALNFIAATLIKGLFS